MGSSIALERGMGSSRHRETIVDSSLGPIQNETKLSKEEGRGDIRKGGKRWRGEKEESLKSS